MARIEINDLTKEFGTLTALDNVSLELEKGQIVGLLGPNGSGKTTLIKLMNGLLTPTEGTVMINGMEPGVGTKKVVAYLPDRNALPEYMTTAQLLQLYQDFFGDFNLVVDGAIVLRCPSVSLISQQVDHTDKIVFGTNG